MWWDGHFTSFDFERTVLKISVSVVFYDGEENRGLTVIFAGANFGRPSSSMCISVSSSFSAGMVATMLSVGAALVVSIRSSSSANVGY
jgi:hypothetical protein